LFSQLDQLAVGRAIAPNHLLGKNDYGFIAGFLRRLLFQLNLRRFPLCNGRCK